VIVLTFFRSLLFNVLFFASTAAASLGGLALLWGPPSWLLGWLHLWARSVVLMLRVCCGIELRVTGRDNLPDGPAIVAAKHQSAFDTFVWLAMLEKPAYVLKKELLSIPIWGLLARRAGHIPVDRAAGGAAMRPLIRDARKMLAAGRPVVIFPEGTRSRPGEHLPFHPGVMALAGLGASLIPVATDSGILWGRRAFIKRPGVITVAILPALPPELSRHVRLEKLREAIELESDRLYRASPYYEAEPLA